MSDPWQTAYNFYLARGYTPTQAAGIVGGLRGETENLNPGQVHDNGIGLGISGWNGPRLAALRQFATANGTDAQNLDTQLAFVDHELRTTESQAGSALRAARTPGEAGNAMLAYFRPSNWNVPGAHPERARYAEQFANGGFVGAQPFVPAPRVANVTPPGDVASAFSVNSDSPPLTFPARHPQIAAADTERPENAAIFDPAFIPRGASRKRRQT